MIDFAAMHARSLATVHLVSGPSSAGKSSYIESVGARYDLVLMAHRSDLRRLDEGTNVAVHYNILRPFTSMLKYTLGDRVARGWRRVLGPQPPIRNRFYDDPPIERLARAGAVESASVLVAPRSVLLERVARRERFEPLQADTGARYPSEYWRGIYERIDLADVYRAWLDFLDSAGIGYRLLDGTDDTYRSLDGRDEMIELLND